MVSSKIRDSRFPFPNSSGNFDSKIHGSLNRSFVRTQLPILLESGTCSSPFTIRNLYLEQPAGWKSMSFWAAVSNGIPGLRDGHQAKAER
jgi:hypothetical protein